MPPFPTRGAAWLAALWMIPTLAIAAPPGTVATFVEVQGPSGLLKGTMLAPEKPADAPLVLIIPGSGPTDRDGSNPLAS